MNGPSLFSYLQVARAGVSLIKDIWPEEKKVLPSPPKPPDASEAMRRLGEELAVAEAPAAPQSTPMLERPATATQEKILVRPGVDAERMAWQDALIRGELWLLEGHLKNKGLGCGGDVECLFKHTLNIIDAARETQSMTTDPLYAEAVQLGERIRPLVHPEDVKSGKYRTQYPALVLEVSKIRTQFDSRVMKAAQPAERPPKLVGPTERREAPKELEFFADSADHIKQSMNHNGIRAKVDRAFQEAIARGKGG